MTLTNNPPETTFAFITSDFESGWDSLAANKTAGGRGNFMFALQAMILLEFASRLSSADTSGQALKKLSSSLDALFPKYFSLLPGLCSKTRDFELPHKTSMGSELIHALYDLIRNGEAHQYQQFLVRMSDGKSFGIGLTGAEPGFFLEEVKKNGRPAHHLAWSKGKSGDIELRVHTDWLYLDVKEAIVTSGILKLGLSFPHIERISQAGSKFYQFDSAAFAKALSDGGHNTL